MKNRLKGITKKRWFAYTVAACSAVTLYMVLSKADIIIGWFQDLLKFFNVVIIGLVIAYLLNPLVDFFNRYIQEKVVKNETVSHAISVALAVLVLVFVVTIAIVAIIPYVINNFVALGLNSNNYYQLINQALDVLDQITNEAGINIDDIINSISAALNKNASLVPDGLKAAWETSVSVGTGMVNGLIGFVIAIYFMLDKRRFTDAVDRLRRAVLPERIYKRNTAFWSHCNQVFIQYIGCSLIDALIIGTANMCFMFLMHMPFIALISVVVGVTNILPTVGPLIGAVIGGLILVVYRPDMALWFLLFTLVLQTIDGYVIKPKLFGDSLGIPPVVTLISIIFGGKLFGVIGVFLSIPVASVLCDLYSNSFLPRLEKRKQTGGAESTEVKKKEKAEKSTAKKTGHR